ncbi:MAG: hypothetical protein ABSE43_03570 [Steroidobacteraceae bacterium]|jgi:protein-S-isoprenylcysteine O-methyltransferase Ste14
MNGGLPREAVDERAPRLIRWLGPRAARALWLLLGLLYVGFVGGSSTVMIVHALRAGRWLRPLLIAALGLLALGLGLRIWIIHWRSLQSDWPPIKPEDTGIWGVGGPGIRQPGGTGIFPKAKVTDDEEPGGG